MYNLENNVEWTDELKDAFKHGVTKAKIVYDSIEINYDNGLKDIEIQDSRYVPNLGFIGQATSKMATINLLKTNQDYNFENKEIQIYIGADYEGQTYYINYGNFIVNSAPENDETNGTIKIVAYDYMIKFNKEYIGNTTFPCTLQQLLTNVCYQAEVELGTTTFANANFIVEDNQFEGKTLREVLQNIAKSAFSWARIKQDNKLYLDFENKIVQSEIITEDGNYIITEDENYTLSTEITNSITNEVEILTTNDYLQDNYKRANEYYGAINKVTFGQTNIKGQEESVEDAEDIARNGIKELVINDNYFAYTTEKRRQLIQAGTRLFGLKYMPIQQIKTIGLVYLDCNDIIEIQDNDGKSVITRCFSHIITYNGVSNDEFATEANSDNEMKYENKKVAPMQNARTEIIVDRQNQIIQSVVSNVTQQNNKISIMQQTVDEINSKISDIADITVSQETLTGRLNFTDINQSEPIHIEIRSTGEQITQLRPSNILYPANNLYIKAHKIRFTNTETNEIFDYELPTDILYYDSENYDEFILDYDSHTVFLNKKCTINLSTGAVELLAEPIVLQYEYPTIELTDGDYRVEMLKYDNTVYACYLMVRLMAKNIYTTQFATKIEMNSEISQTATSINLSVDQKLSNYSTTTQMNAAITVKANEINSTVSTKVGKNEVISRINQSSEAITINANKISLAGKTINLTSDNIKINSTNFKVTADGTITCSNANITGKITATSGKIAGYTINGNQLVGNGVGLSGLSGEGYAFWAGSNSPVDAPFRVGHNGSFRATNADISGTITATSGTFRNCTITNSCTVPASTVSGTLASNTIPNISASKITSGTMSGSRIYGGTIGGSTINAVSISTDILHLNNPYYAIEVGNTSSRTGTDYVVYNDGETGWTRLTFTCGILTNIQHNW